MVPGSRLDQRIDFSGDSAGKYILVYLHITHALNVIKFPGRYGHGEVNFKAANSPFLEDIDVLHGNKASLADDANAVADSLHLGHDVRGKEDRTSLRPGLADEPVEFLLHEGVEADGGLIENEQLGFIHESLDKAYLLPVAVGEGLDTLRKVIVKPFGHFTHVLPVYAAAEMADKLEQLGSGKIIIDLQFAGEVTDAAPDFQMFPGDVESEDTDIAATGKDEMEENTNGGSLAGTVGPEVTEDLTTPDIKVNIKDTPLFAVKLGQLFGADDAIVISHSDGCFPDLQALFILSHSVRESQGMRQDVGNIEREGDIRHYPCIQIPTGIILPDNIPLLSVNAVKPQR